MIIDKKFLMTYTAPNAPEKHVIAKDSDGRMLFQLDVRYAKDGNPFYLDVERFIGQDIILEAKGRECVFFPADDASIPSSYLRPQLHYTVPYGWLNDPNGLIYTGGKYHIFCQHNPLGTAWGNMHWHHAVSSDLVSWEHYGDALFPDDMGTMFSGSAICDSNNASGLGQGTIILFYTIAEYSKRFHKPKFSQGIAYSVDGVNFVKYDKNPVVPNIKNENRDPKVVFVPEMGCYVMVLYLDGDEYCFLKSNDLLDWHRFQTISIPGEWECPDLYSLPDDNGNKKWVLSGASDKYIVGHFDSTGFVAEQDMLQHYYQFCDRYSYAAQSFSGTGDRNVRVTWENINPDNNAFCGQLSVPMDMSLVRTSDNLLRLKSSVSRELSDITHVVKIDEPREYIVDSAAFIADLALVGDYSVDIDGTVFLISAKSNTIEYNGSVIPLTIGGDSSIRLIVDRMSIELLVDGGLVFSSVKALCPAEVRRIFVTK